jgi:hypothetical protein
MVMHRILKPLKKQYNARLPQMMLLFKEVIKELEEARALIAGATSTEVYYRYHFLLVNVAKWTN